MRTNIRAEIEQSKSALESAISLSNDALQQANHAYDEALSLIANINALSVPEINLEKLRTDAMNAIQEVRSFDQRRKHWYVVQNVVCSCYVMNCVIGRTIARGS